VGRVIVHIDLNAFFASVEEVKQLNRKHNQYQHEFLQQNKDLKEKMIDDTYDSFFEAFDRTEEGDWAKIDAFSKEVLDELMQSGTLDEFRANIDAKIVELSDKESTDEDVQRFLALKGSKDEFDTLLKGLFNYISSKINAAE